MKINILFFSLALFLNGCQFWGASEVVDPILEETEVVEMGEISGPLSYPSEMIPSSLEVCAINLADQIEYCTQNHISAESFQPAGLGFNLEVPAGEYHVFARLAHQPDERAFFSEFVLCGMSVDCQSHNPVVVNVFPGITTPDVRPHDWYVLPDLDPEEGGVEDLDSPVICWNRVTQDDDTLYWRDGCRGDPDREQMCTMALVELTLDEVEQYYAWVRDGSQTPEECL